MKANAPGNAGDMQTTCDPNGKLKTDGDNQMDRRHEAGQPACAGQRAQVDWMRVDWTRVKRTVERLQQKIFRETRAGNLREVCKLQKLLARSLAARLWAVKLVTEVNRGRNTPGIDGYLCKSDKEKTTLAGELRLNGYKPSPVKVAWIPKSDGTKRRLSVPTIRDRAMQSLVLVVMSPEWEARFEPHSFGFRPGRSAIDAIHHMATTLMHYKERRPHPEWVFDADIAKCFDSINHEALLGKLGGSRFGTQLRRG